MSRRRFAVEVAIVVFTTLLIAGVGYGGMAAARTYRTAEIHPNPPATPQPSPLPVPTHIYETGAQHIVWDADLVDDTSGWLLLSDCNSSLPSSCHYSIERTVDGGVTWSPAVLLGPVFSSGDGDAPRNIRFLDRLNGFVYGHNVAFVTHDGGRSWTDAGLKGEIIGIAPFESTVWAVTRPCAPGATCPYEVRSTRDGGATWSQPHQLPADFAPESLVAFRSGVILSALPPVAVEITVDGGATWRELRSPCAVDDFRGHATTADGTEIWVVCQQMSATSGSLSDSRVFKSADAGQTWSRIEVPGLLVQWLASPGPGVALADDGTGPMVITTDSGLTWSRADVGDTPISLARFLTQKQGWAMDANREVWWTHDGGTSWSSSLTLPSAQP